MTTQGTPRLVEIVVVTGPAVVIVVVFAACVVTQLMVLVCTTVVMKVVVAVQVVVSVCWALAVDVVNRAIAPMKQIAKNSSERTEPDFTPWLPPSSHS